MLRLFAPVALIGLIAAPALAATTNATTTRATTVKHRTVKPAAKVVATSKTTTKTSR